MTDGLIHVVPLTPLETLTPPLDPGPKAHHTPTGFTNPWKSYNKEARQLGPTDLLKVKFFGPRAEPVPERMEDRPVQVVKDLDFSPRADGSKDGVKMIWIGHASWLVEFPSSEAGKRGMTVLLDPVFSDRMSPVSFAGPKRFTPPPCSVADLPFVDAVFLSHFHYDHCDLPTLRELWTKQKADSRPTRFFVPLGMKAWLHSNLPGLPDEHGIELDWWHGTSLQSASSGNLRIYCTPAQHISNRSATGVWSALWCSWMFVHTSATDTTSPSQDGGNGEDQPSRIKLFFAGDTGYRNVPRSIAPAFDAVEQYLGREMLDGLPHNPSFKQIGEMFGGVDVALLPIGCFNPIEWLSNQHCSPWDAVDIHKDLRARSSVAMHYGVLRGGISATWEPVHLPVQELLAACKREGVPVKEKVKGELEGKGGFATCDVGQTLIYTPRKE